MALQNQCMKPPPHLFLNKLLKPNTENVWGTLPTSLGNLLILQKLVHTKMPVSEVGGPWKCMKIPGSPPLNIHFRGWGILGADTCWYTMLDVISIPFDRFSLKTTQPQVMPPIFSRIIQAVLRGSAGLRNRNWIKSHKSLWISHCNWGNWPWQHESLWLWMALDS